VQTLKAGGSNTMMRLEANCPAQAPEEGQPILADLSRHIGTPAQEALERVLAWSSEADPQGRACGLVQLYCTDITRTRAHVTVGAGTAHEGVVELALDLGCIQAGPCSLAVRELEIELISGHPMAVINAGRDWVDRHGLWLDTQTKAHRGDRLARHAEHVAQGVAADSALASHATLARPIKVKADGSQADRWRAEVETCLEHITGNLSELGTAPADVTSVVHQLQLGLKRLDALAVQWAGTDLALPADSMALVKALLEQLSDQVCSDAVGLSRSTAATTLCLDLLECLVSMP
jgi:triphosphatase